MKDIEAALARQKGQLDKFSNALSGPDLRKKVLALIPVVHGIRDIGSSLISREDASSGRDRVLFYLRAYPRTLIAGDELAVISGIQDWPRRVRELRVEFGWWIYSGVTFRQLLSEAGDDSGELERLTSDLKDLLGVEPGRIRTDQYVLMRDEQDRDAAHRWNVLNGIRRDKSLTSVKAKLLAYFRKNPGHPITGEELRYLAKDKSEWARRTRELRTEDGWPVLTRQQGRPDLPVGSYVLEEDRQAPAHDRKIADPVRIEVLERDGFACRVCGWTRDKASRDDPRRLLELHHVHEHRDGGKNEADNLVTLCNVDHDEVHAGRLDLAAKLH
ncbi:HNH endonuclease [Qipengyuania sp. 1XM1-15A]|uniref:HNH endonuclease n=1 Tax=Qipengyuania xiamenensis TaxID=2867237 RepID=UPI001C882FE0|nr:HNH endonuclease [Qipengyuania xiamenensis]